MRKENLGDIYWTTHDLKRKGLSEAEDDSITGHVSPEMKKRYRVIPKQVKKCSLSKAGEEVGKVVLFVKSVF